MRSDRFEHGGITVQSLQQSTPISPEYRAWISRYKWEEGHFVELFELHNRFDPVIKISNRVWRKAIWRESIP
jgi:hypothetical protein